MTEAGPAPGAWNLYGFDSKLKRWRAEEDPPGYVYDKAQQWWPSLAHAPRTVGSAVPGQPGVRFAWVPNAVLPDSGAGLCGVQCHYRVVQDGRRVMCQFWAVALLDP